MNEYGKTGLFVVVAAALGGVVWLWRPAQPDLQQFSDQGELFYPEFTDPLSAASLEVIDYDEDSGTAKPFRVQVKDGVWSIPSHYDYPADGEDRLASTAAGVIDLIKDSIQSDRVQDHEALGVIDPLDDATTSLTGRGQRVTLRDESGGVLADFIFGDAIEGREGLRYVRLPEKKRTYRARVDIGISTRFADWIETNLLDATLADFSEIVIDDYRVNERTRQVELSGKTILKNLPVASWTLMDPPPDRELDMSMVNNMLSALSQVTITGVRPKPAGLSADLRQQDNLTLDLGAQLSLQSRGFFISADGRLLSNEGEVSLGTKDGVRYTLRFGEVLVGEGMDVSAGSADSEGVPPPDGATEGSNAAQDEPSGGRENRYLFITARFDETLLDPRPVPPPPSGPQVPVPGESEGDDSVESGDADDALAATIEADNTQAMYEMALAEWEQQAQVGRDTARRLNDRFAPWYYVISASDFQNIRPTLESLTKEREVVGPTPAEAG